MDQKMSVLHTIEVHKQLMRKMRLLMRARQKWKNPFFFFFFSLSATVAPALLTDIELEAYVELGLALDSFPLRADEPGSFGTTRAGRCGGTVSGVKYFWS